MFYDKEIEIFGILETKLKFDKKHELRYLADEWSIITNIYEDEEEDRDSIWVGCKST